MSRNTLSTHIEEKLDGLPRIGKERCMYKVHELLRDVNEKAYKPTLVAIGPYHHGKVGQGFMEEHKLCYLKQMLERTKGSIETYIIALRELEERARKCYVECISQTSDQFVEMMLLDGSFIIELFHNYEIYKKTRDHEYDPIFQRKCMRDRIARDLLLFENQLPFFILAKLFDISESNRSINLGEQLNDLVLSFFFHALAFEWNINTSSYNSTERIANLQVLTDETLPPLLVQTVHQRLELGLRFKNAEFEHLLGLIHATISISILDTKIDHAIECHEARVKCKKAEIFKHLFGLIHTVVIPLLAKMKNTRKKELGDIERLNIHSATELEEAGVKSKKVEIFKHLFGLIHKAAIPLLEKMKNMEKTEIGNWNIYSATELDEVGVKFKKAKKSNFFVIKFSNGLMEISPLSIDDDTETYLRNLIANEQYCDPQNGLDYVCNYVDFMDNLINSLKDVELLRRKGIISNCLGCDEIISAMVNKLGHYVSLSTNKYATTSRDLNEYCKKHRNKWMAKLRCDYFNSPWALISFLAAVLLLVLTLVQTIFSTIP